MNTIRHADSRSMLSGQLQWFVRAIAVTAWRWRKPFGFDDAEETRVARERTETLLDAMFYGVLEPVLVDPVEFNPNQIFDRFFATLTEDQDSLHLAMLLADHLMKALEG